MDYEQKNIPGITTENQQDQTENIYENEYIESDFTQEYYEPSLNSMKTNLIGWAFAGILFILAIWLLWISLI